LLEPLRKSVVLLLSRIPADSPAIHGGVMQLYIYHRHFRSVSSNESLLKLSSAHGRAAAEYHEAESAGGHVPPKRYKQKAWIDFCG
jgi:hypothetical protein